MKKTGASKRLFLTSERIRDLQPKLLKQIVGGISGNGGGGGCLVTTPGDCGTTTACGTTHTPACQNSHADTQ